MTSFQNKFGFRFHLCFHVIFLGVPASVCLLESGSETSLPDLSPRKMEVDLAHGLSI